MNEPPPIIESSSASQPRRRPRVWIAWAIIATILLMLSLAANGLLLGALSLLSPFAEDSGDVRFEETRIGGDADAKNKIAVVHVQDLISFQMPGATAEEGMVGDIKHQLARAAKDKAVKAILLAIESPGGEVTASDVIHHAVLETKKKSGLPVVASMGSLATSGGYYVAVSADWIVAHPTTLTGSIGVIFRLWNYRGLMNKRGVKPMVYKSGRMKDMLSPEKEESEITPEERELVQQLVMRDYNRFVGIVAQGRKLNVEQLKAGLADGRVLSGEEALAHKFVDQLGYFEDAVAKAKSLAKIEQARLVKYESPFSLRKLFSLFAIRGWSSGLLPAVGKDLQLENGRLYYLPPGWLH
ncbi:MAG: signal peptide peptidase SppA [Verrucomicrobiae bacterium]|nr:signal peptide peptidase SppA [Verrucomicrobiae bacterium]